VISNQACDCHLRKALEGLLGVGPESSHKGRQASEAKRMRARCRAHPLQHHTQITRSWTRTFTHSLHTPSACAGMRCALPLQWGVQGHHRGGHALPRVLRAAFFTGGPGFHLACAWMLRIHSIHYSIRSSGMCVDAQDTQHSL